MLSLMKITLLALVLVVSSSQLAFSDEKLTSCCLKVGSVEITEPVLSYSVQKASPPCVRAVIFQTKTRRYCSQLNAPWVLRKIQELRRAKTQLTTPPMVRSSSSSSLLSIVTSTSSSPPSSSALISSSSPPSSSSSSPTSSSSLIPSSFPPVFNATVSANETFSGSGENSTWSFSSTS